MKPPPLRLGILSTAGISVLSIINEIKKIDGIILQAVASRTKKRAEEYANRFGIPQAYGSYDELLSIPYIDCVYIPLPNSMHFNWSIKALEKGKNVLCEKPLVTSTKEVLSLVKAQKKSGKVLMEAMHYRYHPLWKKVEEITRGGEIGDIVKINVNFCQWLPLWKFQNEIYKGKTKEAILSFFKKYNESVLFDMGCYTIDAARQIANCNEARIISAKMKTTNAGFDHTTYADILFANGIKASIYVSYQHFFPVDIRVKGTKGSLVLSSPFSPVVPAQPVNIPISQLWIKKGIFSYPCVIFPTETTYYYQLRAFRDAVTTKQEPITSLQNCLANTKIMEDIQKKARG